MRYQDFKPLKPALFEVNMSPGNLEKLSSKINALVGIEYELVMPHSITASYVTVNKIPTKMNEVVDTSKNWKDKIREFFQGGDDVNSLDDINYAISKIDDEYLNWLESQWQKYLQSNIELKMWVLYKLKSEILKQGAGEADNDFHARAKKMARDRSPEWQKAVGALKAEWIDNVVRNPDIIIQFFNFMQYMTYRDIFDHYSGDLKWPYWKEEQQDNRLLTIKNVAEDFEHAIGKPVIPSNFYHDTDRNNTDYIVEPDSSIRGDNGETGLEFISPPQTVSETLKDIDIIRRWAANVGAFTNNTTGLHINVSVPNQQDLDYVKLVLFLGDNHVLDEFGRRANTYCRSMLDYVSAIAEKNPKSVTEVLRKFQSGLNNLASKSIYYGDTFKHASVSNKLDRIEFRGPGGNWMADPNINKVKNTILRMVVALDIATDPDAHVEEYYKKLYKILKTSGVDDSVKYFAEYSAGKISLAELKLRVMKKGA